MTALKVLFLVLFSVTKIFANDKPNVFVILLDDLGFNDMSFRGSNQFFTPNIDALGYNGIILNRNYVPALCTPSRTCLMTGKYSTTTGTQHLVIDSDEPWGLRLSEKLMPEYFKDAGYNTSIFGKWHLGFHRRVYLPNNRGFDHFFGYRGPMVDYWSHELLMKDRPWASGFDMWENNEPSYDTIGQYTTYLITDKAVEYVENYDTSQGPMFMYMAHEAPHTASEFDPLQAPQEVIDQFPYIEDSRRRVLAAMVTIVDEQIGRLVAVLDKKGLLENSVIVLYSDNGGPTIDVHPNGSSNFPFRGQKITQWEGGVRSTGLIWSPHLKSVNRVSQQLMHCTDWLPTLATAAGLNIPATADLDGVDMWNALSNNLPSPRTEVVNNIDPIIPYTSYMYDNWKFVNGTFDAAFDSWLGDIPTDDNPDAGTYLTRVMTSQAWNAVSKYAKTPIDASDIMAMRQATQVTCSSAPPVACDPVVAPCLFNLAADPCEQVNLADSRPDKMQEIIAQLEIAKQRAIYPLNEPRDPQCDPALNNFQWTYWTDLYEESQCSVN